MYPESMCPGFWVHIIDHLCPAIFCLFFRQVHMLGGRKGFFHFINLTTLAGKQKEETAMAFFNSAVGVLQTLVVALGAGLGIWGAINLRNAKSMKKNFLIG